MSEAGAHEHPFRPLGLEEAQDLAETLSVLSSESRLRILHALSHGERAVEELAGTVELSPSATSHHLRLLRTHRLVRARRAGRNVMYSLHDHHVTELLAAIRHHQEHVRPGGSASPLPAQRAASGA